MTPTVLIAVIAAGGVSGGAIIKSAFDYVVSNRTRISELESKSSDREISAWEQWRKDNTELRTEISELRKEVAALRSDIKEHERNRDKAEGECIVLREKLERAEAETAAVRQKTEADIIAIRLELDRSRISLDAALRSQDAYSIAARERMSIAEESKGITP